MVGYAAANPPYETCRDRDIMLLFCPTEQAVFPKIRTTRMAAGKPL